MKTSIANVMTVLGITVFFSTASYAQKGTDTTMIVNGVCGMCENTIETAALSLKGVKVAEWDVETKVLTLNYNPKKVNLQEISNAINQSGYDTEFHTAPDEAYNQLNPCCHYRDPKVVEDHK